MEGFDFHMNKVKELTKKECISRVRKILQADMNGDYTMTPICAYAIPVLCYTFGIMKWTKGELMRLDVKTRKMLTMHSIHHPEGTVHRLYLNQNKGGRGLTGVEDMHNCECAALAKYVLSSTDTLTKMVCATKTPTQKFLLKFRSSPKFTTPELMDEHHHQGLKEKSLHGKFFKQTGRDPSGRSGEITSMAAMGPTPTQDQSGNLRSTRTDNGNKLCQERDIQNECQPTLQTVLQRK
eukprot:121167-Ditylum_brightwellii.AAC.1